MEALNLGENLGLYELKVVVANACNFVKLVELGDLPRTGHSLGRRDEPV